MLGRFTGNPEAALNHPSGFNFILVGFALGAFFLLPSWGSLAWSLLGSGVCVFLTLGLGAAFGRLGSTPSTLPFNLVVILTLAPLRRRRVAMNPVPASSRPVSPEETLDAETCSRARLGSGLSLALPFSGTCRVYQAFDGPWTHKGAWRHAYDFVKCGVDDGNSATAMPDSNSPTITSSVWNCSPRAPAWSSPVATIFPTTGPAGSTR